MINKYNKYQINQLRSKIRSIEMGQEPLKRAFHMYYNKGIKTELEPISL